jgi:hypothetical protein
MKNETGNRNNSNSKTNDNSNLMDVDNDNSMNVEPTSIIYFSFLQLLFFISDLQSPARSMRTLNGMASCLKMAPKFLSS